MVTVTDPDQNRDPDRRESVAVGVVDAYPPGSASRDGERLLLEETGRRSGVFRNRRCLPVSTGPAKLRDGVLQVNPGDIIAAIYQDPDNPPVPQTPEEIDPVLDELRERMDVSADQALIAGGQAEGRFTFEIDPRIAPPLPSPNALPVAAVVGQGRVPTLVGEDQIVIQPRSQADLTRFLREWDGTVIDSFVIGAKAEQPRPHYVVVRVDPERGDLGELGYTAELFGSKGHYRFSSEKAARLFSILLAERIGGRQVQHNPLLWYLANPRTAEAGGSDGFAQPFFRAADADIGLRNAILYLDLIDRNPARSVDVAFLDGGFAGPNDYPEGDPLSGMSNPDYGAGFNSIVQADCHRGRGCVFGPGRASGAAPVFQCAGGTGGACDWHGTTMFSVASAAADNSSGALGVAGHARVGGRLDGASGLVRPTFIRLGAEAESGGYFTDLARGIDAATARRVDVISTSTGFTCEPFSDIDFCSAATRTAVTILCDVTSLFIIELLLDDLDLGSGVINLLERLLVHLGCDGIRLLMLTAGFQAEDAVRSAVGRAVGAGIMMVASGPENVTNDILGEMGPFDAVDDEFLPCIVDGVICVGSIGTNRAPQDIDPLGPGIDIWAPGQSLEATPTPASGGANVFSSGTSPAAAFMAGVLAMMKAANPALTLAQATQILQETSNPFTGAGPRGGCIPHPRLPDSCVGYVDVHEAVKTAAGIEIPCGAWDEGVIGDDSFSSAIGLTLPVPRPGEILSASRSGAIHALPGDRDFVRFTPPMLPIDRGPRVATRVSVTSPSPAFGAATARTYRDEGMTTAPTQIASGTFVERMLEGGRVHYSEVLARSPAARNDNCYDVAIQVVNPPDADRFEGERGNDSVRRATSIQEGWSHEHLRCPPWAGGPAGDCTNIFEDGLAAGEAEEVWTLHVEDLSLHSRRDRDFFRIRLPDPASPADGGHPDLRPPGSGNPSPEPLVECGGQYQRSGLGGTETIRTYGSLTIRVVPTANLISVRPIGTTGESIRLYRDGIVDPNLGSGRGLVTQIDCPSREGLREVSFSFGERESARSLFQSGGYELQLEYKIVAHRGLSEYLEQIRDGQAGRGGIGCLRLGPPGGGSAEIPGIDSGIPSDFFPFCGSGFDGFARLHLSHPEDRRRGPDCAAGGPGCPDAYFVDWPPTAEPLDVLLSASANLDFILFNQFGEPVAEAFPVVPPTDTPGPESAISAPGTTPPVSGAEPQGVRKRLRAQDLPPGKYALIVDGPPGSFDLEFVPQQTVLVDVVPGKNPTFVHLDESRLPVAILGTPTFDVRSVDGAAVRFGRNGASGIDPDPIFEDVDGDGDADLLMHFDTQKTGIVPGDGQACLTGRTLLDMPFQGCERIRTVPGRE